MALGPIWPRTLLTSLMALALLLPGIGAGYWGRDEAEYAGVAHAMNATHDFLVPRLFGRLHPDKPPLSEWLTAASFELLGENEISGRLPHVLLAAGSVALLAMLGSCLLGPAQGAVAGLLLSTSLLLVVYGRLLLTDSDLLFFTLLSLLGLVRILKGTPPWWAIPVAGAGLGLAILAKGPIALLVPALFCCGYLAGGGVRTLDSLSHLALAAAVGLCIALPWFVLAAHATAGNSLRTFFLRENLSRFLHPMAGHRGSPLYVPAALWFGFFPWSGLLLLLFRPGALGRSPVRWALLFWAGGVVIFFSLAATKLPHYLLPAMPALALLLTDTPSSTWDKRWRLAAWATAGTGALLFIAIVLAVRFAREPAAVPLAIPLGVAALLALTAPLAWERKTFRFGMSAAVLASAAIAFGAIPVLDALRSTNRLGTTARVMRFPREPVGGFRLHEPALSYYAGLNESQTWMSGQDVARSAVSSPTRSVLVWLDSADSVPLARVLRLRVQTLAEGPSLADPRVRDLLALCRVTSREVQPRRVPHQDPAPAARELGTSSPAR